MRSICLVLVLGLLTVGCVPSSQELVTQYNDDGVLLYERGEYEHARQSFEAAQKLAPEDSDILYNLAQCHDRRARALQET